MIFFIVFLHAHSVNFDISLINWCLYPLWLLFLFSAHSLLPLLVPPPCFLFQRSCNNCCFFSDPNNSRPWQIRMWWNDYKTRKYCNRPVVIGSGPSMDEAITKLTIESKPCDYQAGRRWQNMHTTNRDHRCGRWHEKVAVMARFVPQSDPVFDQSGHRVARTYYKVNCSASAPFRSMISIFSPLFRFIAGSKNEGECSKNEMINDLEPEFCSL